MMPLPPAAPRSSRLGGQQLGWVSVRFLHYEPVQEANATEASSSEAWKRWVGVVEGLSGIFEKLIILAALGATAYHMLDVIASGVEGAEEL